MTTRAAMRAEMAILCARDGRYATAVMHANAMVVFARNDRLDNADEFADIAERIRKMYREEGTIR